MNKFILFALFLSFLFFGCLSNNEVNIVNETSNEIYENNSDNDSDKIVEEPEEEINISLYIVTNKENYKSAERMNATVQIISNTDFENVRLNVKGVNNRFNQNRDINITIGENIEEFSYTLPRCNVCGGIREGDYEISAVLTLDNLTFINSTVINIKQ